MPHPVHRLLLAALLLCLGVLPLAADDFDQLQEVTKAEPAPTVQAPVPVLLASVDLSPAYAWTPANFAKPYSPELEAEKAAVQWIKDQALNATGFIDLIAAMNTAKQPTANVATYALIAVEAEADGRIHLSMGSDDGLSVYVNGKQVYKNEILRGFKADENAVEVDLLKGRNELLFRVTQGNGGWSLGVKVTAIGGVTVKQIPTNTPSLPVDGPAVSIPRSEAPTAAAPAPESPPAAVPKSETLGEDSPRVDAPPAAAAPQVAIPSAADAPRAEW